MQSVTRHKLMDYFARIGRGLGSLEPAVAPGARAWHGAMWGVILITILVWGITAYYAFAPAGPVAFVLGTLSMLVIAVLVGGVLVGLSGLLERVPARWRWATISALILLLLSYRAIPLVYGILLVVLGLIVFSSLLGAGIAAVTGGTWRRLTHPYQVLALTGLVGGVAGLVGGGGLLLTDGFDTTPPPNAAATSTTRVTPLALPDPSQVGSYTVRTLTYGSGVDRHRPEYGGGVTLLSTAVDGSALVEGWSGVRQAYWGFGPAALPRNGRVWYPDGSGPFPLVLIVHGNHLMEDYSDTGYGYLGNLLASRGFIVTSIDQNFLNSSVAADLILLSPLENDNNTRAWLLLEHVRQWQEWHRTPGNPFYNQVDLDQIALIGHSRGGDAVAIAAAFSRLPHHPDNAAITLDYDFDIQSVIAIAPSDGPYRPGRRPLPLKNVNYLVLQGAHDMDIVSFVGGARQYARLHFDDDQPRFKTAFYVYGANHGQFNSGWGRHDLLGLGMQLFNLRTIMPAAEQEQVAKVTISAFLEATLHQERGYRALFRDPRVAATWLPDTIYLAQYQDSDTLRLATYEEDIDLRSTTLEGGQLYGENLTIWREQVVPLRSGTLEDSAVYLGWNHNAKDGIPRYTLALPDVDLAMDDSRVLTFSLAAADEEPASNTEAAGPPELRAARPLDLTLELVDIRGNRSQLPLSHFSLLQPPLQVRLGKADFMSVLPLYEIVFQTFEFPLAAFVEQNGQFEPHTLREIHFVFDRAPAGVVVLDEVGLRAPAD
jgi:hypothetical protein